MLQQEIATKDLTMVGEEISHELGAKMVTAFQEANPKQTTANYIGRNILEKILGQPGCVGIRFYHAINELNRTTLVYVGVDSNENVITQYTGVNQTGELVKEKGIVADRTDDGDWGWF